MRLLPGLTLTFSWRRAVGLTRLRQRVAHVTGIPTTRGGLTRKFGNFLLRKVGL